MRPDQQEPSVSILWLMLALLNLAVLFALLQKPAGARCAPGFLRQGGGGGVVSPA